MQNTFSDPNKIKLEIGNKMIYRGKKPNSQNLNNVFLNNP